MPQIADRLDLRISKEQDERDRLNLLPTRILKTYGKVTSPELLLEDHPMQVFLGGKYACRLENEADGECAAVLLDFGREYHGTLLLTVAEVRSLRGRVRLRVRYGESVMEALAQLGHKNAGNDHAVRDRVCDVGMLGTIETGESAFRFALIRLEEAQASVDIQTLQLCLIFRDLPWLGSFSCDDPLLQEIWQTAAWTVQLNMQNYIWDGAKRDRLVWQGDLYTEMLTIEDVFGAVDIVPKTMDFLREHTVADSWINGYSSYSLWYIIEQAEWYRFTGDRDYLHRQRDFLISQLALALAQVDESGAERLPAFRFLDWQNLEDEAATHAGLQALLLMALRDGAYLMDQLGETARVAACRCMAGRVRMHVPDCGQSKQAAALMALSGLGDAKSLHEQVIRPGGAHGYSTFMGYYILAAKARAGDWQGALQDLRDYWGGMLQMGATSFWEDFQLEWMENAGRIDEIVPEGKEDIHGDRGAFCYAGFRHSLCHGWASGPVPFLTRYILGVRRGEPGGKSLVLQPQLGDLTWVRGSVPTAQGVVHVSHARMPDGSVKTEYDAPAGIQVTLAPV